MTKFKEGDTVPVEIPEELAYWIERVKRTYILGSVADVFDAIKYDLEERILSKSIDERYNFEDEATGTFPNQNKLARVWLDGYEVEKEKTYKVRMVGLYKDEQVLHHSFEEDVWYFRFDFNDGLRHQTDSRYHTKAELEQAGFGGVFDNPMFEVEEVEE